MKLRRQRGFIGNIFPSGVELVVICICIGFVGWAVIEALIALFKMLPFSITWR